MRNIDFILALTLISLSIAEKYDLLTIDLEINPYKTYRIKEESDNSMYTTFSHTHLGLLLRKSYNLFLKALKENGFKCIQKYQFVEGSDVSLKCDENYGDFSTLKLIFNFSDHSLTYTTNELFTKEKDNYYYFNFRASSGGKMFWVPLGKFNNK